ncbi:unnamed protein product [Kluyveromyces dobzhanskii CBS 2104]|uniref:WGS project CCBQ000000000 data, contig 00058 n=1 Tax=Kluyveromyces dobzhanskii CBS 2104 TaxID=1427455 RepID=A0A0A8LDA6_9SACH|nr:unnamed protein product [Kluyveromyces dobzhanskii CBS 2104]
MLHTLTQYLRRLLNAGAASVKPVIQRCAVRDNSWWAKIIYPFSQKKNASPSQSYVKTGKNQCFLPIRSDDELNDVLLFNGCAPLILNFTVRGDQTRNTRTEMLNRIVLLGTHKRINICEVETDFLDTRDAMLRFGVTQIPTLVAVRGTFPVDSYTVPELRSEYVSWSLLEKWVEKNADE